MRDPESLTPSTRHRATRPRPRNLGCLLVGLLSIGSTTLFAQERPTSTPEAPPSEAPSATRTLPAPDPDGVTVYQLEDVKAAGELEWAWAIASDHGDLDKIEEMLAEGFDPDTVIGGNYARPSPTKHGGYETALHRAARLGYTEVARRLLAAGADPTIRNVVFMQGERMDHLGGATPLHAAAAAGHVAIVQMLLEAGVPVDLEGTKGRTALSSAANHKEVFDLLLASEASVEKAGGPTALFASTKDPAVGRVLLELGADINGDESARKHGYTPLWRAVTGSQSRGLEEWVRFLLDNGADPSIHPSHGTLVELARGEGREEVAAIIEQALENPSG